MIELAPVETTDLSGSDAFNESMSEVQTPGTGVVDFKQSNASLKAGRHKVRTTVEGVSRLQTQRTLSQFDRFPFTGGLLDLWFLHGANSLFDQSTDGSQGLSQVSLRDESLRSALSQGLGIGGALENPGRVDIVAGEPFFLFGRHVRSNRWQIVHRWPGRGRRSSENLCSLVLEEIVQLESLQVGSSAGVFQWLVDGDVQLSVVIW